MSEDSNTEDVKVAEDMATEEVEEMGEGEENTIEDELLEYILEVRSKLLEKFDVRCLSIGVILNDSNKPAIAFHGDLLDVASFSNAIAKTYKDQVSSRIDRGMLQ